MNDIAIIVPTLGRPDALAPLAANIASVTPRGRYCIVFVVDADDTPTHDALALIGAPKVLVQDGSYPVKTNAGVRASDTDWVLLTADDVIFHPGWYEKAARHFPDFDVIGTSDTTPATADGLHATMPIVRRAYVDHPGAAWDEPGNAFHEGYRHNYVETELWQLATDRGVAVFEPLSVIEHLHPDWGTRPEDDTDRKGNRQGVDDDRDLFERRRKKWRKRLTYA